MFHKRYQLPGEVRIFGQFFTRAGFSCYLVGGAVRNLVAGQKPNDYDFATNALPEDVMRIFRKVIPTGIKHGTVTVLFKGEQYEVTTFRIDADYSDGRRPDAVTYTPDILQDLSRRDFTINAMAVELTSGNLVDPHDGRGDIKRKLIRAIGDPESRFREDGLRLMRACRFTSQLGFSLEEKTRNALSRSKGQLFSVSPERIRDELVKILSSRLPSVAFRVMEESGILNDILPELARCRGIEQKGFHDFDVLDHLLFSCDGAPEDNLSLRLAALFHDIGKVDTKSIDQEGFPTFHHHEQLSVQLTADILGRFRFSNEIKDSVLHLIQFHMFHYTPEWSDGAVRRFVAKAGLDTLEDLFTLRRADQYGMAGKMIDSPLLEEFRRRIEKVVEEESAFSITDLAINGKDLQGEGVPSGPLMGTILRELFEAVLDDPGMNEKERLLHLARKLHENYS
jgi:tRNA nucleotidyltransferase (CCA-adding enzyme)